MTVLRVPPLSQPQRLDLYLVSALQLTRTKIQTLVTRGDILLNGKIPDKAGVRLKGGEVVEVSIPEVKPSSLNAESIPLSILFEDDFLLAVNKPAGLVVHPAAGNWSGTLVNALLYHFETLSNIDPVRPGIVHRLDKDTSGILLVAKQDKAHLELSRQLKEREIDKFYQALVHGKVAHQSGVIDKPVGRHPKNRKKMTVLAGGREALTRYEVLERFKDYTLLVCKIETGRTHQIRVHLSSLGHPVVGDEVYGKKEKDLFAKRQLLHAWKLRLKHPVTGKLMTFEAPLPEDFLLAVQRLRDAKWKT